ncbi:hypothetical protein ACIRP0_19805 [Streptomyces sp. NPDC101733]|uniref:hypothetical protein n=1 Tax=unclassified Streptomyces TaxID=2593676 RepID=UPI00380639B0
MLSLPANPLHLRDQLDKGDRKKLAFAKALNDPQHAAWRQLTDESARVDGQAMLAFLSPSS